MSSTPVVSIPMKKNVVCPQMILFRCPVPGKKPSHFTFGMKNSHLERVIIKVKCSSNEIFRIEPPVALIDPGKNIDVMISIREGKSAAELQKGHFIRVFMTRIGNEKGTDVKEMWRKRNGKHEWGWKIFVGAEEPSAEDHCVCCRPGPSGVKAKDYK